ncbi:hypothetical protein TRFO_17099 [Tritrichomonas foetus]|uniref:BACK domain-containing protein n=1 Tax=Tritrichomonas foetus TaxID=1144522 RepID=A0A1J4KSS8_9EUKA|nr:hypothetical protein TRFO_17099 [Tritrichomonas foetus]|eukprot:OHT12852.1 hypothetical protein TRFO_17099 [Tritrichomonas foetus]
MAWSFTGNNQAWGSNYSNFGNSSSSWGVHSDGSAMWGTLFGNKDTSSENKQTTSYKNILTQTDQKNYFCLSYKGLSRIESLKEKKDFILSFGGNQICCNRFSVVFLSPKIYNLLLTDPTIDSFDFSESFSTLELNPDSISTILEILDQLFNGREIYITDQNRKLLLDLAEILENEELGLAVIRSFEDLSEENTINRLNYLYTCKYECNEEIDYVSQNFEKFSYHEILKLDLNLLKMILSNSKLVIEDEDSLYRLINKLIQEKGDEYQELFETIHFENLSCENVSDFLNLFDYDSINIVIWNSLCRRLVLPVNQNEQNLSNIVPNQDQTNIFELLKQIKVNMKISLYNGFYWATQTADTKNNIIDPSNTTRIQFKQINFDFGKKFVSLTKVKLLLAFNKTASLEIIGFFPQKSVTLAKSEIGPVQNSVNLVDSWYEFEINSNEKFSSVILMIKDNPTSSPFYITRCEFYGVL